MAQSKARRVAVSIGILALGVIIAALSSSPNVAVAAIYASILLVVLRHLVFKPKSLQASSPTSFQNQVPPAHAPTTREEIITRYLSSLKPSDDSDKLARSCLREVAQCEGWLQDAPSEWEYLSKWERRTSSEEHKNLARTLEKQFRERRDELKERQVEEETAQLWQAHQPLINKFLEIAERKVSILDDYGDERWDLLPKEIETCVRKIIKADGYPIAEDVLRDFFKKGHSFSFRMPAKYRSLCSRLRGAFILHHQAQGRSQRNEESADNLSGTEFEILVSRILKAHGYEVRGTPATGDQGADLIASKDGKKIVVQAKRYNGTVGNKAVQEVTAAINFYGASEGWVVTNATFTPAAKALAQKNNVRLIDGDELSRMTRGMEQSAGS